ncbi:calcium-binding EF-hand family protein [Tasmannia lanceolata]|uniref:calcium-binding EF-hand family protein n=1 Tax=Tasmannia lanceolata TaxID=3420 RepID=UPI00406470D9
MEVVREAALVHYRKMSPSEKESVVSIYKGLDANGDGKISKDEFINVMNELMPSNKLNLLFAQLDRDNSGSLDFYEFITFYYACKCRPSCDCCSQIITDLYYSCIRCWEIYINSSEGAFESFDLCNQCYSKEKFEHTHVEFADNYVLLRSKENSGLKRDKPKESSMEEILRAGRVYCQALNLSQEDIAHKLFRVIDTDGNGKVSVEELIEFLTRSGMSFDEAYDLFVSIDMTSRANLSLEDVVALFYIFSMRPRCDKCRNFVMGSYYSCVACFTMSINDLETDTYELCPECYRIGDCEHEHQLFLDNYALLHMKNQLGSSGLAGKGKETKGSWRGNGKRRNITGKIFKAISKLTPINVADAFGTASDVADAIGNASDVTDAIGTALDVATALCNIM